MQELWTISSILRPVIKKTVAYRWNQDLCPRRTAGPQGYRGALNRSGIKAGNSKFIAWSPYFCWKFRGHFLDFLETSTHHMMPSIMLTKHKNMMMLVVCGGIVGGHGLPQWEVEYCGGGWMAGSCWVLRAIFLKRNRCWPNEDPGIQDPANEIKVNNVSEFVWV